MIDKDLLIDKLQWVSNAHLLADTQTRLIPGLAAAQQAAADVAKANAELAKLIPELMEALRC